MPHIILEIPQQFDITKKAIDYSQEFLADSYLLD